MLRFDHALSPVRRPSRLLLVAAGVGALLSGCGFIRPEPREPWRAEAEAVCMRSGIIKESPVIRATKPIDGPGPCGADLPLKVSGFQNDATSVALALASTGAPASGFAQGLVEMTVLKPEATLGCPMVAWTDDWIATGVQPAAIAWFGQGVKEIRTAGSYACRRRNHQANARLSEHAFGNAIDVMTFVLNDGYVVTVKGGWRGTEQEQGFLRDVFHGACQRFKTVLGPGSDALHYDHFHLDLARHDASGQRRYCKPQVAAPQRPLPGSFGPANPYGGPSPYAYNQTAPSYPQQQSPAYPQQQANGTLYNRPPQPLAAQLPPVNAGMLAARPRPGEDRLQNNRLQNDRLQNDRLQDDSGFETRQDYEVEPEFDPKQFDITTGSIPDLPRPRAAIPHVTPPAAALPDSARTEYVPAPRQAAPRPTSRRATRSPRVAPSMNNPAGN